ncbi:MAG: DegT/DnrJ/EryC1/StrS family aminotransferase [Gammaproteobacteria bacterium]|nr:DegT/DnrJ/EryC1/StrS family aminotransferase [Gammaproteobacteria bacterium]
MRKKNWAPLIHTGKQYKLNKNSIVKYPIEITVAASLGASFATHCVVNSVALYSSGTVRDKHTFTPNQSPVPVSGKIIGGKELEYLVESSLDAWLTTGRFNEQFEQKLATFLDIKHVLTTNSGSSANLLALTALTSSKLGDRALKRGDEVITVAAGFPTTVNPILQIGLIPVFIDIDINTYNIDASQIEGAISNKTKAYYDCTFSR